MNFNDYLYLTEAMTQKKFTQNHEVALDKTIAQLKQKHISKLSKDDLFDFVGNWIEDADDVEIVTMRIIQDQKKYLLKVG